MFLVLYSYLLSMFLHTTVKGATLLLSSCKNTWMPRQMIFTTSALSLKGDLEGSIFFSHTKKSTLDMPDLQLSIIVSFLCAVFVSARINTDSTTIYFCAEQCKHKSQTFDGCSVSALMEISGLIFRPSEEPICFHSFLYCMKNNFRGAWQSITTTIKPAFGLFCRYLRVFSYQCTHYIRVCLLSITWHRREKTDCCLTYLLIISIHSFLR